MKVKELIKKLEESDPTGDLEVSVDSIDVFSVYSLPAYYDGAQQVLIRDETKKPYFDVVGAKFCDSGRKIVIKTLSISDLIWDKPDAEIDFSDLSEFRKQQYKENIDKLRKESKDFSNKLELEYFTKHIKKRAVEIDSDLTDFYGVIKEFFEKNLNPNDPIPADIPIEGESYITRREKQWEREVKITHDGFRFNLSK